MTSPTTLAPPAPRGEAPAERSGGRAELHRVLREWNDPPWGRTPLPPEGELLHDLVEDQTAATPDAPAVAAAGRSLSYRELDERSNRLARHLRDLGVGPEVLVGICTRRTPEMVVGLLGVLKAGGAYLPLDPSYPERRLAFMLEDSRSPVVVTEEGLEDALPVPAGRGYRTVLLDAHGPAISRWSGAPLSERERRAAPGDLAYLIYTSGSTGRAKGVAIEHRSAAALVRWAHEVFGPEDLAGVLASTSICFDLSVFELFVPLAAGGAVLLARDALALPEVAAASTGPPVTLVNTVPSAMTELLARRAVPDTVRTVNLAGEALLRPLVDRVYGETRARRVFNLYGPSEDTTYSTVERVEPDSSEAPAIGRPVANTSAYLLDPQGRAVPGGEEAELLLGGAGLARGYFDRPALTAEHFLPDGLSGHPGARLYRTGDLARHLPDGRLHFLGRIDHQVKVRGFRIELGEVEAALLAHPAVHEAVVVARAGPGGADLAAYLAARESAGAPAPAAEALREFLGRSLPSFMVPSRFVLLDALPRTPNGKVDRKALPDPGTEEAGAGFEPPATATEAVLAGVWGEVLGMPREGLGRGSHFFTLGGHSLLATRLLSRVRDAFGVELSMAELFAAPHLAELARRVDRAGSAGPPALPPLRPGAGRGPHPLSFAQQRLWVLDRLQPGLPVYNLPSAYRLEGELDRRALARALSAVVRRHESLRTRFSEEDGRPVQRIDPPRPVPLPVIDLAELPEGRRGRELRRLAREEARRPFDLARGPLFRAALLACGRNGGGAAPEHLLLLTLHHVVSDAWSQGVMNRELGALYEAARSGSTPPATPGIRYADFARWQHSWPEGVLGEQLAHWRRHLEGATPLELPADRPRPPIQSFRGGVVRFSVPDAVDRAVLGLARAGDATPFMAWLAAFEALVHRWTGRDDLVVGVPVANRGRSELEPLIGFFVNLLPIRVAWSGHPAAPSGGELLARVRRETLEAFDRQDLPFERLVEELRPDRDLSRNPLCQVAFQLLDRPVPRPELPGLAVSEPEILPESARFDLAVTLTRADGCLTGEVEYARDLFDRTTVSRAVGHLLTLAAAAAAEPHRPVDSLPFLTRPERHALLLESDGPVPARQPESVLPRVVGWARRRPDAVAVAGEGGTLTYGELLWRAEALARRLRELGARPDRPVAVCLERSPDFVVTALAAVLAGAAYLPLDPAHPPERLTFTAEDAGATVVVCREDLAGAFREAGGRRCLVLPREAPRPGREPDRATESRRPGHELPPSAAGDSLAYVIYTSGSTGRPKGVGTSHRALVNLVAWHRRAFATTPEDRTTLLAQVGFDASVWELWPALAAGSSLHVPTDEVRSVPERLRDWLVARRVTVGIVPTPLAELLLELPWPREAGPHLLLTGGDRLHRPPPPGLPFTLVNNYGPTECAVVATWTPVAAARDAVETGGGPSIGSPVDGVGGRVVDAGFRAVPLGVPGELCLAGPSLARGYPGRPGLTAERFVPDPFVGPAAGAPGDRLYRTGDLVRRLPDGSFGFLGRADDQVKIRGFRIELGEIEAVLAEHPAVREAAVVAPAEAGGARRLVAYWVPAAGGQEGAPEAAEIRAFLGRGLPDAMVPWALVPLPELPRTPAGKVNRQSLLDRGLPEVPAGAGREAAPRGETEALLAGVWSRVLGAETVGREDDFFDLGGHSLLAAQVVSRLRDLFGVEVPLRALFAAPTVAALAEAVEAERRTRLERALPPLEPMPAERRRGRLPLSFAQQRLWFLARLDPDDPTYNIPTAFRLRGPLDRPALARSLGRVAERHETLRTRFREDEAGPYQEVLAPRPVPLPVVDLSGLPPALREREAARAARREAWRPFDLAEGDPLRALLLALGDCGPDRGPEHLLLLVTHHIASDGWSQAILHRELSACYRGEWDALPELPVQYADFAAWQRDWLGGALVERQLTYWRERLDGAPGVLELPTDRPRPPVRTFRGDALPVAFPPAEAGALRELARRGGATLFMTLLAGFQAVLGRLTGRRDVLVGSVVANRNHSGVEDLVGFFVNALVMRGDLSGDGAAGPAFAELQERTRRSALDAYDHQDLPFERLVDELRPERSLSHQPLIQVMFGLQSSPLPPLELPGLEVAEADVAGAVARFDLTLALADEGAAVRGILEYNADLFDRTTVARLGGHLRTLLGGAAAAPEEPVGRLPLLTPGERQQALVEWNDTRGPYSREETLGGLFAGSAARHRGSTAVVWRDRSWTYGELAGRVARLARLLRRFGVGPGVGVGVWMERSLDLVTAVLATVEAGGFYLPLDAAWPAERAETILAGHRAPVLLTRSERLGAALDLQWRLPELGDVVCLDVEEPSPPAESLDPESVRALWDYVAERATDRVSAGGFVSRFTGEAFSEGEVDEYRDRVLALAEPYLAAAESRGAPGPRVLEVGCGSGLILWELAPRAARYVGVDPSEATQERNRELAGEAGLPGLELVTGFAHELDDLEAAGGPFDLVVLASTVQFFPGPLYLEQVLEAALARLAPGGAVVVADVMDARRRSELETAVAAHAASRATSGDGAPAGRSTRGEELFLDEGVFRDFAARRPRVGRVEVAHRREGFDNELGFRYDVVLERRGQSPGGAPAPAEPAKRLWTGWHLSPSQEGAALPREVTLPVPAAAGPGDLAYVIHTSGSTGAPKGIAVQHRPVVNLIEWVNRTFCVGPGDRLLFVTSLCFDLSVYDLFGVLAAGGTVHVAPEESLRDPEELLRTLREEGITIWDSAPAALQQLAPLFGEELAEDGSAETGAAGGEATLRLVLLSGDWIPVSLPDVVRRAFPGSRVVSLGGATEATIWSNWYPVGRVEPSWPSIPYGRPISNARYHVLDRALEPAPAGVPGDLHIGGECLCVGYASQPALTAAQFLPDPGADRWREPGARIYRTGDRARHFPGGNLEFLGRTDYQVKIRGFRIELGEIEVTLERHPEVRQAVVLARPAPGGDRRLVACTVAEAGADPQPAELREHLARSLPEYMVPAAFVLLDGLPMTANGKVDRKALAELAELDPAADRGAAGTGAAPPATPTEELVAGLWESILEVRGIGRGDHFFELGGHSLLATQVVARLRRDLGVEVPLRTLFQRPTMAELAAAVEELRDGGPAAVPELGPAPPGAPRPLSASQLRLWFLVQVDPLSADYNLPVSLRLAGRLEPAALARALAGVIERHEVLRTTFVAPGGRPEPVVHPRLDLALPVVDLSRVPAAAREAEARALVARDVARPFDLARGPLLRTALLRLAAPARPGGDGEHLLLATVHHIVFDGWSLGVLIRELAELYRARAAGEAPELEALPLQYGDFAHWQREWLDGAVLEEQVRFWRSRLEDAPALLALPTDRPRPAVQSYRGGSETFTLPAELGERLRALAAREGATLFMVLLAALETLLHRYTGQDDLSVGTFVANRRWSEIEGLIGFFVNTLVLRGDLAGGPSFRELLGRLKRTTLDAYEHQELPFERLLEELDTERDLSRTPLFQVMFGLQSFAVPRVAVDGLTVESVDLFEEGRTNADLALWTWEEGSLRGWLQFNGDLFDRSTARRLVGHLGAVLGGIAADPERRLRELPLLSPAERHQALREWAEPGRAPAPAEGVVEAFRRRAARSPDAVAVVAGETALSYGELDRRSRRLARRLRAAGAIPDAPVALALERSPDQIVALLAILRVGSAYLPLDPALPDERLQTILTDSGAVLMVGGPQAEGRLDADGVRRVAPEVEALEAGAEVELPPPPSEGLAYVIYTSGSTGRPKGVGVSHRSLAAFVGVTVASYGLGPGDRVLQFGTLSFDASVEEIFPTLAAGAALVLRDEEMLASPARFLEACRRWRATAIDLPTAYGHELAAAVARDRPAPPPGLRLAILGGEAALPERVDGWLRAWPGRPRLVNTYGPTEATVVATAWELTGRPAGEGGGRSVPIGRPLAGVRALLLDPAARPVPAGVVGELHLGGTGVARGYLGRPALTAERFVPAPSGPLAGDAPGARLYRTGDLARRRGDGVLEFVGRVDHQVKVRGFRIEPDEVAAVLARHPAVSEAVVVARDDGPLGSRLVAYAADGVHAGGAEPDGDLAAELAAHLRRSLPAYMVPAEIVPLPALPRTPTGKVDREALPAPAPRGGNGHDPPETPTEELIAGQWRELLGVEAVGAHDDFFDLGGHSLLAPQAVARLGEACGLDLPVRLLLEAPTVARLAVEVERRILEQIEAMSDDEAEALTGEAHGA